MSVKLKIGAEAPAVRVKTIDGQDDVIGCLANGIQILYMPTADNILFILEFFEEKANEYKKLLPTIALNKNANNMPKMQKTKIVVDENGDYLKKYENGIYAIDEDGIIVYAGDDLNLCFDAIMPLLNEKDKKHKHEDWMRSY